ncbi:hypothetical protein GGF43_001318 [Coemansia sp. RSA 2618]|nr:hypothetical protein GGF43_001318 [Coemansia sp. RSA 2618]
MGTKRPHVEAEDMYSAETPGAGPATPKKAPAGRTRQKKQKRLRAEVENVDPAQPLVVNHDATTVSSTMPPFVSLVSSTHSLHNRGRLPDETKHQRDLEADHQVRTLLQLDEDRVLELARPADAGNALLATALGKRIAAELESRVSPCRRSVRVRLSQADRIYSDVLNKLHVEDDPSLSGNLDSAAATFRDWIMPGAAVTGTGRNERRSYPRIQALHQFVAHLVRHYLSLAVAAVGGHDYVRSPRLILPYEKYDTKPVGSDDDTRSDIGLVTRDIRQKAELVKGKNYYDEIFVVVEAKASTAAEIAAREAAAGTEAYRGLRDANTMQAFKQLFQYTRQVYANQHDRRFTWGVTACDSKLRACMLTCGGAFASREMDVCTAEGRQQYIQLLVNWSLCDWHQLGFDPSIRSSNDVHYWEIDVPCLPSSTDGARMEGGEPVYSTKTYYFDDVYVAAERLFGRHTRCIPATSQRPTSTDPIVPEVLIKDTWSVESHYEGQSDNGERGEFAFLTKVRELLDRKPEYANNLPRLEAGGPLRMLVNGSLVDDTTDSVLGTLGEMLPKHKGVSRYRYSHVRMAMTPIGQRLREIESVVDLVLTFADAIKAHKAVLDECNILHRDVSENNILFWRDSDQVLHGLLIDFDNAVDVSVAQQQLCRPICTGTFPFMSINNLRCSDAVRTAVDDMESFMYLLIWLGTWGVTAAHRKKTFDSTYPIGDWIRSFERAIISKQSLLSVDHLLDKELDRFYGLDVKLGETDAAVIGDYQFLKSLVQELRTAIFYNPHVEQLDADAIGTATSGSTDAVENNNATAASMLQSIVKAAPYGKNETNNASDTQEAKVDSFEARANPDVAKVIHNTVFGIFDHYATQIRNPRQG